MRAVRAAKQPGFLDAILIPQPLILRPS